ncbi:MAG: NUDIX domain-containing protein [Bacteroidaceae bacterium]
MTELVLAVNRDVLQTQRIGLGGVYPFELVDTKDYALVPRPFADAKTQASVELGKRFAQILSYVQVFNHVGKILAYQRKGKEGGLLGKWSVGIGGHVSQDDMARAIYSSGKPDYVPPLLELIVLGTERELSEELGLQVDLGEDLESKRCHFRQILSSDEDIVSSVHVGLPFELHLSKDHVAGLELDPSEFNNWEWMSIDDLKYCLTYSAGGKEFETWSRLLIEQM